MIAKDYVLWVTKPTYAEIRGLLAGTRIAWRRELDGREMIDLHGIALMVREDAERACSGVDG